MDKQEEFKQLIDPLYDKIDAGDALESWEDMAMSIYNWLYENGEKPELD